MAVCRGAIDSLVLPYEEIMPTRVCVVGQIERIELEAPLAFAQRLFDPPHAHQVMGVPVMGRRRARVQLDRASKFPFCRRPVPLPLIDRDRQRRMRRRERVVDLERSRDRRS